MLLPARQTLPRALCVMVEPPLRSIHPRASAAPSGNFPCRADLAKRALPAPLGKIIAAFMKIGFGGGGRLLCIGTR